MPAAKDRLHGMLDLLILKTLTWGPRHGYAIAQWIGETSGAEINVEAGSLYPALYRMEQRDWIEAEWGMTELGRKGKIYSLTRAGREHLKQESAEYRRFTATVLRMLAAS